MSEPADGPEREQGDRGHAPRQPATAAELAGLVAEERHARQRLDLYRAKTYAGRAGSTARLHELERRLLSARARLDAARGPRS